MDDDGVRDDRDADAQATVDLDRQDILFLRHVVSVLAELRTIEASGRVRYAADRAVVAICERIGRAARRDLPADAG